MCVSVCVNFLPKGLFWGGAGGPNAPIYLCIFTTSGGEGEAADTVQYHVLGFLSKHLVLLCFKV